MFKLPAHLFFFGRFRFYPDWFFGSLDSIIPWRLSLDALPACIELKVSFVTHNNDIKPGFLCRRHGSASEQLSRIHAATSRVLLKTSERTTVFGYLDLNKFSALWLNSTFAKRLRWWISDKQKIEEDTVLHKCLLWSITLLTDVNSFCWPEVFMLNMF